MKRHSNYTLKRQRPLVSVFKETAKRSLLPPYNLPVTQTSVTTWKSCHRWLYKSLRLRATRVSLYVEKCMDSRGNKEKWNIMNIYIYMYAHNLVCSSRLKFFKPNTSWNWYICIFYNYRSLLKWIVETINNFNVILFLLSRILYNINFICYNYLAKIKCFNNIEIYKNSNLIHI